MIVGVILMICAGAGEGRRGMFERKTIWRPAFDKRHPDPKKNYGIHGVEVKWLLTGDKGAVQFVLYTGWNTKGVRAERHDEPAHAPMPTDIGYHSPVPMYEGQTVIQEECPYLNDRPCYYDGSGLNAERYFDILTDKGEDALWKALEAYYRARFEGPPDAT